MNASIENKIKLEIKHKYVNTLYDMNDVNNIIPHSHIDDEYNMAVYKNP